MTSVANGIPQIITTDMIKAPDSKMADESVEMSGVPLMQEKELLEEKAEEIPMKEEATTDVEKPMSKFRQFFSRDRSRSGERKTKEEKPKEEATQEATDAEAEPPVEKNEAFTVKKERKWFHRKPKEAKENGLDAAEPKKETCPMTIGINLLDRDEKNVNEHVKLSFEDVFAEPDGYHSFDCVWRTGYRVFVGVRCLLYRVLALLFVLPCAVFWAVVFALFTACNVWACTPFARALAIPATWLAKCWNFFVRSLMDPLFRSCGLCLGSINVRRFEHTEAVHMA